ncbi:MAG: ABC transporter ATP-binding protein [Holosporales bacterium]|jgi:multiple sugar transport system ATP-binding protein|nr:ABC transporter ATP-binding protein [Holosporales bacterium]
MATIALKNVTKDFKDHRIIAGIDLEIAGNACTALVGPSGCGKSTLLRLICGLEEPTTGEIHIDGQCVNALSPVERGIAMVFQSYALYPHMTVFDNMAFALKIAGCSKTDITRRVQQAAKTLQVDHLLDRKPKQLSGGQRQRVAIGRAIVRRPKAFLFDEPLSNLDAALRFQMRYELARLKVELKTTMVYVTHDQEEAMTMADMIVVMREGCIEQQGVPLDLYYHPKNIFVASFIGSPTMNFLKAVVEAAQEERLFLRFLSNEILSITIDPFALQGKEGLFSKGSMVTIGIRPEDISEGDPTENKEGVCLKGNISFVENLGNETYVYVTLKEGEHVSLRLAGSCFYKLGQSIFLFLCPERCHVFDANGMAIKCLKKGHDEHLNG